MLGGTSQELGDAYLRFSIGQGIGEMRNRRKKTLDEVAQTLNLSSQEIQDIELGQAVLPIETLMRLLKSLDVGPSDFFRDILPAGQVPTHLA